MEKHTHATDEVETVEDIKHLHNKTQDVWVEKLTNLSSQVEQAVGDIRIIKKDNKKIKQQMKEVDPGHCVREDAFLELNKKYDGGNDRLTEILIAIASLTEKIDAKNKEDVQRNGKVDKIDEKEDESAKKLVKLEERMARYSEVMDAISSLNDRVVRLEEKQSNLNEILTSSLQKKDTKSERRKDLILRIIVIAISVAAVIVTVLSKWWPF